MTTDAPAKNPLYLVLIIVGALLILAAGIVAAINLSDALANTATPSDLEFRELTFRLIVFLSLPGAILVGLGIPLHRIQPGTSTEATA